MRYISTRQEAGKEPKNIQFKDAVMIGMAEDGGLLLPESYPKIDVTSLKGKPYADVAYAIIKPFVSDIDDNSLKTLIAKSYASFSHESVVPLVNIGECYLAELFHGPTFAFKDVALQLLGNLFEHILKERNEKLNIIGATSGDTGSAAIYGVKGKDNIEIVILYPDGRVSPIQELQMTSVTDPNVHTFAVDGTFDDCQDLVKAMFADVAFKKEHSLGAVNSINWARVMAQIVYYFYTYLQMPAADKGDKVTFVIPSGNFGNIFAGYCAKQMGLPIEKLVLATNANDILHRFISKGDYSVGNVAPTYSPSMDIQVASNFERYLYYLYGKNTDKIRSSMQELKTAGKMTFTKEEMVQVHSEFMSYATSNKETEDAIRRVYENSGYTIDPHTACGVQAAKMLNLDSKNTVVLATAHPAKFADVVEKVTGTVHEPKAIKELHSKSGKVTKLSKEPSAVRKAIVDIIKK